MHILFASHRYYPVPGGTERIAQLVAEGVVRRGHQATLITQREPGTQDIEEINGVTVRRIPVRSVGGMRISPTYWSELRRTPADLFHLHGNRIWCADLYFPVARRFRWPQILTGHGFYQYAMHPKVWDEWYFTRYLPRQLRAFDAYACITEHERRQLLGWGVPPERLVRVFQGIDLGEFAAPSGPAEDLRSRWGFRAPFVAVYAGGFFENKRVDRLIEAAAGTGGRWALLLLGRDIPGSPYNAQGCLSLAKRLGVEVQVAGAVPRETVVAAFLGADAIVNASDYEGFGVTLVEAMAAGRPFISWETGIAPELARDGAGFVVDTVPAFSQALGRLEDGALRSQLGERGKRAAPNWSTEAMVGRYVDLYHDLLERRARR